MDYRIEKRNAFEVLAMSQQFSTGTLSAEISKFWDKYFKKGHNKIACGHFGIYCPTEKGKKRFN